jgi:hypothetical protein
LRQFLGAHLAYLLSAHRRSRDDIETGIRRRNEKAARNRRLCSVFIAA